MDLAYLNFLNQVGINPIDYIQIQASYLRYLAKSYNRSREKSKSCSFPSKFGESNSVKLTRPTEMTNEDEQSTLKKPSIPYEDIPIKPGLQTQEIVLVETLKEDKNIQKEESPARFQYLKKKSRNLSVNPVFSDEKTEKPKENRRIPHKKSQSVNVFRKNENSQKNFLKKGQGKLCSQLSKSLSLSPSGKNPSKSTKSSPNSQKTLKKITEIPKRPEKSPSKTQKVSKPLNYSSQVLKTRFNQPPRALENQRYQKMVKELETKSKKFDQDAKDFYKAKAQQLNDLENWKKDLKSQVFQEKLSLKAEIMNTKPDSFNIADEVKGLREKITKQEENFSSAVKELHQKIEKLKQENDELVSKFKSLQPNNLLCPSEAKAKNDDRSRRSSEPPSQSRSREVPRLNLDKIVSDLNRTNLILDVKKTVPKANLQKSYFSLKK
jgi:uncharacterized coiled-coil protein SlyX